MSAAEVMRLAANAKLPVRGEAPSDTPASPFSVVDLSGLGRIVPPEPISWWGRALWAGEVTIVSGHGGAGKSTVMGVQLGAHLAVGAEFLQLETRRARVAYYSAEDPLGVVMRRLDKVCRLAGLDVAQVRERFHLLDASDGDGVLFVERRLEGTRAGVETPAYAALAQYVEEHAIDVLIVDNASDVYGGDEINRPMVRSFIRSLAKLVRSRGGAVVLLMHVDKRAARGTAGGSDNYSGSTAWHNSARSRLFLESKGEGTLKLTHEKSNYGCKHSPILLRWPPDGLPELDLSPSPVAQGIADRNDLKAILSLIQEFSSRGESVATSHNSPSNAAKVFATERTFPKGRKPGEITQMLRDAQRDGLVERETYRDSERKPRERWRVSEGGREFIRASAPCAPSARSSEVSEHGALGAGSAPSAPTPCAGGVGDGARTPDRA